MNTNNPKTILLVDDEALIAIAEAKTLGKYGYTVITAFSGEKAIEIASRETAIDLILMDIDLGPGMDGTQAASIILEHLDIPVLFLSSHTEPEIVDKTEKITSYGYVVKNSGETVLMASVSMAFKLHAAHRELRKHEEELTKTIEERRVTEEALRKSEKELAHVFDNSPGAIVIADVERGVIVNANKGVEWSGWTREELIGKNFREIMRWYNQEDAEKIDSIMREKGKIENFSVDSYRKNGTVAHIILNAVLVQLEGRLHTITVATDITKIKESETQLMQTKEELEAANEELNATVEELEATNEEMLASNEELEESKNDLEQALTDLKEKEYFLRKSQEVGKIGSFILEPPRPGQPNYTWRSSPVMDDIIGIDETYPKTRESFLDLLVDPLYVLDYLKRQAYEKKDAFELEYQIKRRRDGEVRWIYGFGEPIYDEQGNLTSMIGTGQDITDRKRADEALRLSEERYRTIFEKSATANIITAEDTTILLANSNFEKLVGYSREEMEGKMSWTFFVLEEYLEKMKQYNAQRRTDPDSAPQTYEFKARVRSGEIKDFFMSVAMIPGTRESMVNLIDVTSLKQAEERFSELVRFLPETVFETDLQGSITFVNEFSLERFGYTREDLDKGLTFMDIIVPEDHKRGIENIKRIIEGEQLGLNEYMARKKDGTRFPSLVHTALIIRNGRPSGLRGFQVDISERKRAEEALRESEDRWQFALEGSGDGVWDWNAQTNKVYFSHQWKAMLGYEDHEIGNDLDEWDSRLHPDDRETVYRELNRHLEGITSAYISEHRLKCKNGEYRWILDRGKVLTRTPDGRALRVIGTHTDITERKRAEERYATFIQTAPDGFVIFDKFGHILDANDTYVYMLGYTREELLKMSVLDIEANFNSEEFASRAKAFFKTELVRFETRHRRKDGADIDVEVSIRRLEYEYDHVVAIIRDITDRKKAENELKKSYDLLKAIVNAAPTAIIGLDLEGNVHSVWNQAAEKMLGWKAEEVMGKYLPTVDADNKKEFEGFREWIRSGQKLEGVDVTSRRKGGSPINCSVYASPIHDLKGKISGNIVVMVDITERKQMEEALKESQEIFRLFLDYSPIYIFFKDENIRSLQLSGNYETMLGKPMHELIGKSMNELFPSPLAESMVETDRNILQEGKPVEVMEVLEGRTYITNKFPIFRKEKPPLLAGFTIDITERKQAEEALGNALREKESLLHELQHRMKNSLAMIIGIIELEMDRLGGAGEKAILKNLKGRIDSLSNLYTLLFQTNTVTEVALDEYIHSIISSLSTSYIDGMGAIHIEQKCDPLVVSVKNATAWGLIVNELLTNALKYAFPKKVPGRIYVRMKITNGKAALSVSDNGAGPPAGFDIDQPKGFGLLLVKMLAQQLNGALSFKRGKENVFTVRAPV